MMKRYLIFVLVCVICFTACVNSVDAEKEAILFGNSLSDVAAAYGYNEADALSVAKSDVAADECCRHYDVYAFDGASFGDHTADVLLLGKSYQLDADGKQWDLGISSIEYRFSADKFDTYQDFCQSVQVILSQDSNYHKYGEEEFFYQQDVLSAEDWNWIEENTLFSKSETEFGYLDPDGKEQFLVNLSYRQNSDGGYSVIFSSLVFPYLRNKEAAEHILQSKR